jgi:ATP-dependent protease ClpP protease subunit
MDDYNIKLKSIKKRKFDDILSKKHKEEEYYKFYSPLIYTVGKEVHFSTDVNKMSIEIFIRQISDLIEKFYKDNDDNEKMTITYIVDSPGGSVHSCFKFIDFVGLSKKKYPNLEFVSIISGIAASAGSVMSVIADKRYITKYAYAMIHEISSGVHGRYTQMESYMDNLKDVHKTLTEIYYERCKLSLEQLEIKLKTDKWYTSEQYLADGFVDAIK